MSVPDPHLQPETDPNLRLWNDVPATEWLAAFPIGNGQIGGMVFGGIEQERIGLNHERLWRGATRDRTTANVAGQLPAIREAFFASDMAKGAAMAEEILGGGARRIMPYQPVGDLWIETLGDPEEATAYERELELLAGVASTNWRRGQFEQRRLSFVSANHNVLVTHLETTDPAGISVDVRLDRATVDEHPGKPESPYVDPADITLTRWSRGHRAGMHGVFSEGISFAVELRVFTLDGEVVANDHEDARISIRNAASITIVLGIMVKTEPHLMNSRDAIASHLDAVPTGFGTLLASHLEEHVPAMQRVSISLPTPPAAASLPLRKRLARLRDGEQDPGLTALYFTYGRYLLFSSSRRCSEPANLQGIWCQELKPAWQCDFHLNINIQMNYWPAEVANLAECLPPLVQFIERFVPSAKQAANDLYGVEGVLMPHATDVWGRATPEAPVCDVWQGAASWLAQHLWSHWEFSGDLAFLADHAYPYMKECAAFWTGFLVPEAREGHPLAGRLVSVPSNSPENSYFWEGHKLRYGIGATMDLLLAREILENCIAASEILAADEELRASWVETAGNLAPLQVGKHGQLQEYLDDWDEPEPSHRHVSHLYGIFPGNYPTPEDSAELFDAARVSLERRLEAGGGHTGWSRSWVSALWARFGDGKLASDHFDELIGQFATDALLDLHPPRIFQIDGNFGGTAAVAEMLLQSHRGVVRLLPALPPSWNEGAISGLRARGQVTVALEWISGLLVRALLVSKANQPIDVQVPDDRDYRVLAYPTPEAGDRWGAEEFAAAPRSGGIPVEVQRNGNRLTWKPDSASVYEIAPA
jgi:alpha-L-fucosidase 2